MTAALTICICVRNGETQIGDCIEAIAYETSGHSTQILVVDHNSTDRTLAIARGYVQSLGGRLEVLVCDTPGIAAVRDFAWRKAQTPWVAYIDSDCTVQPGWAKAAYRSLEILEAQPDCGAVGGRNLPPVGNGLLYRAFGIMLGSYVGGHNSILNRPFSEFVSVGHCPTLNVIYRRDALNIIRGFDLAFTRVAEDLDVSLRLQSAGYRLWACPDMLVVHGLRRNLSGWLRNMHLYGRGRCYFIKRYPRAFEMKFLLPPILVLGYLGLLGASFLVKAATLSWLAMVLVHSGLTMGGLALPLLHHHQFRRLVFLPFATFVTVLTHLAYGTGFLYEIPQPGRKFKWHDH